MSPPVIFGRFYAVLSVAAPIVGRFYAVLSVTASKIGFLSVIGSPGLIYVWFLYNLIKKLSANFEKLTTKMTFEIDPYKKYKVKS